MEKPKRKHYQRRAFFDFRFVKTERRRHTKRWALILVAAIPLFFLTERYLIGTGLVTDVSMLPTLPERSYFLIHKYPYLFHPPRRGDIVVFQGIKRPHWRYIKRVIALPGERILIRAGEVYVNEKRIQEPYALGPTRPDLGPLRIPEGHFFLLGDNRANSEDSRSLGPIPIDKIEGKIDPSLSLRF